MTLDAGPASWITLTQVPGLGNQGLRRLLQAFGSPEAVLHAPASALTQHVKSDIAAAIACVDAESLCLAVSEWLQDPLNRILTVADTDYPRALFDTPDPPLLLYAKGRTELLNRPALAIVGSRNATAQGRRNAEAFARSASDAGLCIISGMAQGIDAAAHAGGLQGRSASIAVVGTGLDKVYPAANRELAHELSVRGLLISEFALGTSPLASNFPRRNRIISGLSLGSLVVEASLQSGSLITARLAVEQGREVFAIPGSIHSPQSRGCHALLKQGAKLVETVADILDELKLPAVPECLPALQDHALFAHLGFDPVDIDSLQLLSGLTISELSAILLQLELDGRIATLPGGLYQRIA